MFLCSKCRERLSYNDNPSTRDGAVCEICGNLLEHVDEYFGMFKEEPAKFEDWVGVLLELKGYRKVIVTSRQDDGGKDIVATDRTGKKTFVECKLWDPDNWEINVGRPDAQKLVGAMVVAGINQGLVVTTANLTEKAKQYIKEVNSLGYHVQFIEGDALMRELYDLREIKLKPLLESV